MICINIKSLKPGIKKEASKIRIRVNEQPVTLGIIWKASNLGSRPFLICPKCGKKRTRIYLHKEHYICRSCLPIDLYAGIKNVQPGSHEYIAYRMQRISNAYGIEIRFPFQYQEYQRPRYKKRDRWEHILYTLQALENMRFYSIITGNIWNRATIISVMNGTNTLLKVYDLETIRDCFIIWDLGNNGKAVSSDSGLVKGMVSIRR